MATKACQLLQRLKYDLPNAYGIMTSKVFNYPLFMYYSETLWERHYLSYWKFREIKEFFQIHLTINKATIKL